MTVLRQSPWYEEILKEGSQQGLQQGLQQGELIIILKLLNNRLGSLPSDIQQQITNLSTSQLEKLSDQILHFTNQNELKQWLIHEN
jgi:predicted transposase YdaD